MTGFIAPEFDEGANNGLPGPLPAGEHIIWQGRPNARAVGRHVMKTRWIAAYFGVMLAWLLITGFYFGRAADDIVVSLVIMAAAGAIAEALGVTRQAVHKRFARRVDPALARHRTGDRP